MRAFGGSSLWFSTLALQQHVTTSTDSIPAPAYTQECTHAARAAAAIKT